MALDQDQIRPGWRRGDRHLHADFDSNWLQTFLQQGANQIVPIGVAHLVLPFLPPGSRCRLSSVNWSVSVTSLCIFRQLVQFGKKNLHMALQSTRIWCGCAMIWTGRISSQDEPEVVTSLVLAWKWPHISSWDERMKDLLSHKVYPQYKTLINNS
ncbi:MAG: hypothetical protein HQM03_00745 [Magnetococcales bacterium]|nr:hypothetical protein [Magnetococcales bacterium]